MDFGKTLSSNGVSHCTYVFKEEGIKLSVEALNKSITQDISNIIDTTTTDESSYVERSEGNLIFRIDHKLFDAQRGLKIVLSALENTTTVEDSLSSSETYPEVVHLKLKLNMIKSKAKEAQQSVTQWLMACLLEDISDETVRMIISQEKEISHIKAGNHFAPLDLKREQWLSLLEKDSTAWKKTIERLSRRNIRSLEENPNSRMQSALTFTSVGSLSNIDPILKELSYSDMLMFPDNVAYCPSIITIYSVLGTLNIVLSGKIMNQKDLILERFHDFKENL